MTQLRQIILDTETTGLDPSEGHRILEIGCVEMIDRQITGETFHEYCNPDRKIDREAQEVHGLSNSFLAQKPKFAEIAPKFLDFVRDAEVIIHNAPFDVGFIDHELNLLGNDQPKLADVCAITDSLTLARKIYPGVRNSLDALCRRLEVDNSNRTLHGALLDSQILAEVYLAMTGGQKTLDLGSSTKGNASISVEPIQHLSADRPKLSVLRATAEETQQHDAFLAQIGVEADVRW